MAVSSYFLQKYLCYLTAPVNVQCSCHPNLLRHGQQEIWINNSTIYLLTLCGNATQDVGAMNASTFSIIHCPTLRDKGDTKFPLWLRLGATPLPPERKKRLVHHWWFLPHRPLPIPKLNCGLPQVWVPLFSNTSLPTRGEVKAAVPSQSSSNTGRCQDKGKGGECKVITEK